jgi:hypothetical protein
MYVILYFFLPNVIIINHYTYSMFIYSIQGLKLFHDTSYIFSKINAQIMEILQDKHSNAIYV